MNSTEKNNYAKVINSGNVEFNENAKVKLSFNGTSIDSMNFVAINIFIFHFCINQIRSN